MGSQESRSRSDSEGEGGLDTMQRRTSRLTRRAVVAFGLGLAGAAVVACGAPPAPTPAPAKPAEPAKPTEAAKPAEAPKAEAKPADAKPAPAATQPAPAGAPTVKFLTVGDMGAKPLAASDRVVAEINKRL